VLLEPRTEIEEEEKDHSQLAVFSQGSYHFGNARNFKGERLPDSRKELKNDKT
jgi:hypothetical protein